MKLVYRIKTSSEEKNTETSESEALAEKRQIYSVSQITNEIRFALEEKFTSIWLEGEITNFKFHSSGHMYFSLKDESAQVGAVMFRRENYALNFEPCDGMKVVCFGRISVYAPRGQYQLYVEKIQPKGVGELQIRFEKLKEKLFKEGLFDETRKRQIPFLPRRIALVTSLDGSVLKDMLNVLARRFSSANLRIFPVPVQGQGACDVIAEAIDLLNQENAADVMILARGGGSLEDLWAFNEEVVARAIYHSAIPVISAIGHETDFTIADFVADLRAATPSAAAELVLPRRSDLMARIAELEVRSMAGVLTLIKNYRQRLTEYLKLRVLRDPLFTFEARSQRVDELVKHLKNTFLSIVLTKKEQLSGCIGKLDALGPLATLKRGFSVTLDAEKDKVIVSVRQVKKNQVVKTKLVDGYFTSRILEVENGG